MDPARAIPFLSQNDSIGSVVLAASSSARASLFARYGPSIGPRLALASSCERIRDAIPFLPTESFRPAGTMRWDRSCWLRLLPQELRCSLDPGLNHGPQARVSAWPAPRYASSCERIGHAVTFLPTASFRLRACLRRIGRNCQRYFWFSAYHATAAMKATTASTAKKILRKL